MTAPAALCQQYAAIWPVSERPTAAAVCTCESGGNPNAHCLNCAGVTEDSRGIYQINIDGNPEYAGWDLFNPATNAKVALAIWQSQGWGAWSTYADGCWKQYVGDYTGALATTPLAISHRGLIFLGLAAAFVAVAL